eukprot:GHVQ01001247.1.p1 GENE.GHVQ01001247.1~~GHVQ01001247.1.p1  ORF type:complete len:355 (+),score=29.84 GHVQ01001247.1:3-1067(+)
MSVVRMVYLSLCIFLRCCLYGSKYDVIIVDGVSAANPLLYCLCHKLLFYCHYPDKLLCQYRSTMQRRLYRVVFDFLEELTTGTCDQVIVNSNFTKEAFRKCFSKLRHVELRVIYPPVDLDSTQFLYTDIGRLTHSHFPELNKLNQKSPFFLSINRYEFKKNVGLAIDAFGILCEKWKKNPKAYGQPDHSMPPVLIIGGGCDETLAENRRCFHELSIQVNKDARIPPSRVVFLRDLSADLRWYLMYKSTAVVYTPYEEHFGMVPCEAMAVGASVIASRSGGVQETVVDKQTGYLCDYTGEAFAEAMGNALRIEASDPQAREQMRNASIKRVNDHFALAQFSHALDAIVVDPARRK